MDLSTKEGRQQQGKLIKLAALAAGISLEDLAKQIGCSRALIYQYASGKLLAQNTRLQQIASVTGRPVSYFFEDGVVTNLTDTPIKRRPRAVRLSPNELPTIPLPKRALYSDLKTLASAYATPIDQRGVRRTGERMIQAAIEEGSAQQEAEAYHIVGNASLELGEYKEAIESLEKALEIYEAEGMTSRALLCRQSLGHVLTLQGKLDAARRHFDLVARSSEWSHQWQGEVSLAAVCEQQGLFERAEEHLSRASELASQATDEDSQAAVTLYLKANRINLLIARGDYASARALAEQTLEFAELASEYNQYLESLINLGICDHQMGHWRRAGDAFRRARILAKMVKNADRVVMATAYQASLVAGAGQFERAIALGTSALESAMRLGGWRGELAARNALAQTYLRSGALVEAYYHCEKALSLCKEQNHSVSRARYKALEAEILRRQNRFDEALEAADAALEQAEIIGQQHISVRCQLTLAKIHLSCGRLEDALNDAKRVIALAETLSLPDELWDALCVRAQVYVKQSLFSFAEEDYKRSIRWLERLRNETAIRDTLEPEADADFDTLLLQAECRAPYLELAQLLQAQDRAEEAEEVLASLGGVSIQDRLPATGN